LPDFANCAACGIDSAINCTWPAIRSVNAGALPRYGMLTKKVPVAVLSISGTRCETPPLPAEP
jgi:hypothetical protein